MNALALTRPALLAVLLAGVFSCSSPDRDGGTEPGIDELEAALRAAETSFAATMANRDFDAFVAHLAPDAIFSSGDHELRGRDAVAQVWKAYFLEPEAPFAWEPEVAQVLDTRDLGLTSGPVLDAQGQRVGTFNSVWRRNPDGTWRIVFDRGCP